MPDRKLTHNGETLTVRQWADRLGFHVRVLNYRINAGWPIARVLSPTKQPPGRKTNETFARRAARIQRDFDELVREMNWSLTTFQRRIQSLTEPSVTPAVGSDFSESAPDQLIPSAQDLA